MLNLFKSLFEAQYAGRVCASLGSDLTDHSWYPAFIPLVRKARMNGLKPDECTRMIRLLVKGVDSRGAVDGALRDAAINAALAAMESNRELWEGRR